MTYVIIVSNDGRKFYSQKVILSSRAVFKQLLENKRHSHPLIYMSGVEGAVLKAVLEFIYSGDLHVEKGEIEFFMKLTNEMKVFGWGEVVNEEIQVKMIACKYWNKGFFKIRGRCNFDPCQEECKTHEKCGQCEDEACNKRHRKHTETGSEMDAGKKSAVNICTLKRLYTGSSPANQSFNMKEKKYSTKV